MVQNFNAFYCLLLCCVQHTNPKYSLVKLFSVLCNDRFNHVPKPATETHTKIYKPYIKSKSTKYILTFNIQHLHDLFDEIVPCGSQKCQHFHAGIYCAKTPFICILYTWPHFLSHKNREFKSPKYWGGIWTLTWVFLTTIYISAENIVPLS